MPPRKKSPVPDGLAPLERCPLVPRLFAYSAFLVSFCLPNLVFSGTNFFDTLHLMKWVTTLVPLALLGVATGYRTARFGQEKTGFRIDSFAVFWLLLLFFVTVQPIWAQPRSTETFFQEWFFFASLWLTYVLAALLTERKLLRALLWGALLNAAINVLFAEMQLRGLAVPYSFIAPLPGEYLGNTGQQNMFALWMAMAGVNGSFLLLSGEYSSARLRRAVPAALLLLLAIVFRGLITSTSRSGIMALTTGFTTVSLFYLRNEGRKHWPKIACVVLVFLLVTGASVSTNQKTAALLTEKLGDIATKPLSLANRDAIWATGWTMFTQQPWRGVGLGQFKWNYLDATNEMLRRRPNFQWQYTHWAHNEFLQWMAETGIIGALLMFLLWGWWAVSAFRAFVKKEPISPEAVWGNAMVTLFFFNALWTRPFHRIENVVWLALAFAVSNREILRPRSLLLAPERFRRGVRLLAGTICLVSLSGLLYLGDGIRGDRLLRLAEEGAGGDMTAAKELYRRAYGSLMVKDTVEKRVGYFSVRLGELSGNADMIADGLNVLIRYFEKQPHVEELVFLDNWARKMGDPEFIGYVESFFYRPPAEAKSEDRAQ